MIRASERRLVWVAVGTLLLTACPNAGEDRVLGISSGGEVRGLAYFDADRSGKFENTETPMQGVKVYLLVRGAADTAAKSVSDAAGVLRFEGVPVGRYDVQVDQASVGDTVVVVHVDTSQVDLTPDDTVSIAVGVSYPLLTVSEARSATPGTKVFVEGVALTGANVFADTTAHLTAATGALRLVRVFSGAFAAGDSIRARGTVAVRDGGPVLRDVSVFTLSIGTLSPPDSLPTATAATANGGVLDAGLARIGGTLQDSVTVGRDLALDVDDGSGVVRVLLDGDVTFQLSPYVVNPARVIATGVLVPGTVAGTWSLKPRSTLDLKLVVDVVSTSQARQRSLGSRVFVDGVALNRPNLFGDSTLHLADTQGAIRIIKTLQGNIFGGDSIRVAGTLASREGQPVLMDATIFRLGLGAAPIARPLTTAEAATAGGGTFDAALVRVTGMIQSTSSGPGGDFRAVVSDGSGNVTIVLDGDIGFSTVGWTIGASVDVRGLLVPESGVWVVKPRAPGDVLQP